MHSEVKKPNPEITLLTMLAKHLLDPSAPFESSYHRSRLAAQEGLRCLAALESTTKLSFLPPQPEAGSQSPTTVAVATDSAPSSVTVATADADAAFAAAVAATDSAAIAQPSASNAISSALAAAAAMSAPSSAFDAAAAFVATGTFPTALSASAVATPVTAATSAAAPVSAAVSATAALTTASTPTPSAQYGSRRAEYKPGLNDRSVIAALLEYNRRKRPAMASRVPNTEFRPVNATPVAALPKPSINPAAHRPGTTRIFRPRGE